MPPLSITLCFLWICTGVQAFACGNYCFFPCSVLCEFLEHGLNVSLWADTLCVPNNLTGVCNALLTPLLTILGCCVAICQQCIPHLRPGSSLRKGENMKEEKFVDPKERLRQCLYAGDLCHHYSLAIASNSNSQRDDPLWRRSLQEL